MAKNSEDTKLFQSVLTGAFLFWALWFLLGLAGIHFDSLDALDHFGGWFNVISSLFSSLALVGAIYAVYLQREELKEARLDRKEATRAHKSNADSQEKMVDIQAYTALLTQAGTRVEFYRAKQIQMMEESERVFAFKMKSKGYGVSHEENIESFQNTLHSSWPEALSTLNEMIARVRPKELNGVKVKDIISEYQDAWHSDAQDVHKKLAEAIGESEFYEKQLESMLRKADSILDWRM